MNKNKGGYIEGFISILINSGLFILKMWAGIITGSIALTADAWHTLSDSMSSFVVIIAVKLSSRKADEKHPFGHGKWEQIAALFIAFILGIIAYDFLKGSVLQFREKEAVEYGTIAIIVTIISIVVKEALAQFAFYIGRKTNNVSVKADGWHHRSDALSSVVVLIGIFFAKKFWWIDSVLGIIISGLLLYATFEIAREAINKLLGEQPGDELIENIKKYMREYYSDDFQAHHFHIHNYVNHQELTFHIKLENKMTIEQGHDIASGIETMIHERLGIIATIHIDPLR